MNTTQALDGVNKNYAFRNWEDLSRREQLLCMISDDYKSLYGVRPRGDYSHMTDDDLQKWHDMICLYLKCQMDAEAREELMTKQAEEKALSREEWTIGDLVALPG
jgi:hypothetical protein